MLNIWIINVLIIDYWWKLLEKFFGELNSASNIITGVYLLKSEQLSRFEAWYIYVYLKKS